MSRVQKRKEKKRTLKRRFAFAAGGIALLYLCGSYFFSTHYFPGTSIGDLNIGFESKASAKKKLKNLLAQYKLEIQETDGSESISSDDVEMTYTDLDSLDTILKQQNHALWIAHLTSRKHLNALSIQVNSEQLEAAVDALQIMNPSEPVMSQNPQITYSEEEKQYTITPEFIGNVLDRDRFCQAVTDCFTNLSSSISVKDDTYYIQPTYTSEDEKVIAAKDLMNQYMNASVTYQDGSLKLKVKPSSIRKMLSVSDDYDVTLDESKVKKYVSTTVVKKFNSILKADGTAAKIPEGMSAYAVNTKKETKHLIKNLTSTKTVNRKPDYSSTGLDRDKYNLGKTYVDISIGSQHIVYVESGKIALTSDVVTGNVSTGHATPTGIYHIAFKQRNHLMVKYNSFVNYWMPYDTTSGIGLHDATWRSSFGGGIYKYSGSHGCINMPYAKAAALYSMISTDTPVYVHY